MEIGDKVLVDVNHPGGGYEAEIVWIGNLFARIKHEGDEWDIMKRRLTKPNN